ncbi:lanosterol 14-alpha-demethylase [Cylindrobasidium torrendii FP15055 ss-10]|uniref:Lanosterol 14-alpha-demethylase n=1 Tax=Cylindrobasidium torrendii FP15055 ss-10 TaxID=1314674 RepID=A0A0D7BG76_9AGAR|nr:lanosterol 14-alpha-demethylase [Cylindrobasidium torrendii FP15055 ss-10]
MASFLNSTNTGEWTTYLEQAGLAELNTRNILLALGSMPIIAIVLNVISQLLPADPSKPPLVFHWLPFVGSAVQYGMDPLTFFAENQRKFGNVFTFVLFGRKVTVCLGPQGNNFVLGGKSTVFNAEDAYQHLTAPIFGDDVVYAIPNEKFMEQKKFVKWALNTDAFRSYAGLIEHEATEFLNHDSNYKAYQSGKTDEWGTVDALEMLAELTILTAARTLQGKEIRSRMDKTFAHTLSDLDGGFVPINFLFRNLPLPHNWRRDAAHKKISQFYVDIIKRRRENRRDDEAEYDIVNALRDQKYRGGDPVTDSEVGHMLIALLMAGQHTSMSTGSWTLLHIAADPELGEKLFAEQVQHFRRPDGTWNPITYDETKDLPLLDAVIRETLRIHPPIHSILRHVRDNVPVPQSLSAPSENGTYVIPKGYYVLASPAMSQTDATVWDRPFEFDYTRWTDNTGFAAQALNEYTDESGEKIDFGFGAVSKGTNSPYQPFGAGRHRCIGEQFAYLQLSTIISKFLQELELRMDTPVPRNNYQTMIATPDSPRMIRYRRRTPAN